MPFVDPNPIGQLGPGQGALDRNGIGIGTGINPATGQVESLDSSGQFFGPSTGIPPGTRNPSGPVGTPTSPIEPPRTPGSGIPPGSVGAPPAGTTTSPGSLDTGFNIPFNGPPFPNLGPNGETDPFAGFAPAEFGNLAKLFSDAFPGIALDPILGQFRVGDKGRSNILNALSGPAFQGNPFRLPNSGTGIGTGLNLSLQQSSQQEQRANEVEALLRALIGQQGFSSPSIGGEFLAGAATDLVRPGNLANLRSSEQNRIREDVGQGNLAGQQALRDAGLLGGGGQTQDALIALQNVTNRGKLDAERALTRDIETLRRQNLTAADQGLRGATDIAQTTQVEPTLRLAQMLSQVKNPLAQEFIGNLFNAGQLGVGAQLAKDAQPSSNFFGNIGFKDILGLIPSFLPKGA